MHDLGRLTNKPSALIVNWLGVELRVDDRQLKVQMARVRPRPAFDRMELIAVRIRVFVSPCSRLFERDGINDKGISIPRPDLITKEGRVGIGIMLSAIKGDQPIRRIPVEKCRMM